MSEFVTRRISNYDGFKALDSLQEKIATGKLKPPRGAVVEHFCPLCHCTKKSMRLVKSQAIGVPVAALGVESKVRFQGRFVLACEECARDMDRAGVR